MFIELNISRANSNIVFGYKMLQKKLKRLLSTIDYNCLSKNNLSMQFANFCCLIKLNVTSISPSFISSDEPFSDFMAPGTRFNKSKTKPL